MKPYSNDLRRRIVEAYDSGEYSLAEVAELFTVSLATVKNFVRRYRLTGSADALPHAGGRKAALNEKARSFIAGLVKQDNDLTLAQLCKRAKARHKKAVSVPTMGRLLQALDLPRKKSRSTPQSATLKEFSRREVSTGKRSAE
jgi:transposase